MTRCTQPIGREKERYPLARRASKAEGLTGEAEPGKGGPSVTLEPPGKTLNTRQARSPLQRGRSRRQQKSSLPNLPLKGRRMEAFPTSPALRR